MGRHPCNRHPHPEEVANDAHALGGHTHMKIKINGGTAREGEPALCLSCRFASIVQGTKPNHEIIRCSRVETNLAFKVTSCTEYINRNHPSLYHMEDIAWVLRTDA